MVKEKAKEMQSDDWNRKDMGNGKQAICTNKGKVK